MPLRANGCVTIRAPLELALDLAPSRADVGLASGPGRVTLRQSFDGWEVVASGRTDDGGRQLHWPLAPVGAVQVCCGDDRVTDLSVPPLPRAR